MKKRFTPDKTIHRSMNIGWLRAAVLGANDGIISTAGLLTGIASAGSDARTLLLVGISGLCAGAMSMAAGEYVSVSSQADTEKADLEIEKRELKENPRGETKELQDIYEDRGLTKPLAKEVAHQLMDHDALEAHARDELGINEISKARPLQAALSSAVSFSMGAVVPVAAAALAPRDHAELAIVSAVVIALIIVGTFSARMSGAPLVRSVARVVFWGAFAMLITSLIGKLSGQSV